LSGRKIGLDEIIEPEQDEESSAAPKNILKVATAFMAPASTICCIRTSKFLFNQVGHNQIE
jgi:hypothetical protein